MSRRTRKNCGQEKRFGYLDGRGVAQVTARYFGIGHHRRKGLMEGRAVIPIHDEHGFLIAYPDDPLTGRSLSINLHHDS